MAPAKKSPGTSTTPGDETPGFTLDKEPHHQSLARLAWCYVLGQSQQEAKTATALLQLLVTPIIGKNDNPVDCNWGLCVKKG